MERFNCTILNAMMTAIGEEHGSWEDKISEVQCGINNTVSSATTKTPSELLYGFRPTLKYDVSLSEITQIERQAKLKMLRKKALVHLEKNAKAMKNRYDKNRLEATTFKVGDMVMVERTLLVKGLTSGKLVQTYVGPVKVSDVLGNDRYRVQSLSADRRRFKGVVANDRLKLFKVQTTE